MAHFSPLIVSSSDARRLLLSAQALADDPAAQPIATAKSVARLVERMGFVQVDTISTVERAHHLILAPRMNGYRPALLASAIERHRLLFEHWTHDASIIPMKWYPHWQPRFERSRAGQRLRKHLGKDADRIVANVLERISAEGPLSSRDFEDEGDRKTSSWWGWKPHKIALDHLWHAGALHIAARRNFHKVYDLTERVAAKHASLPRLDEAAHIDWACRTALHRLGTATLREIAQFWAAISVAQVKHWIQSSLKSADVIEVLVESADDSMPRRAYAFPDVKKRIARAPDPPGGMRLLCPFDPVLRDRARALRLFNFDFRFEGFVPAAKRIHGYYVMAILEKDRFVGKADPKFDRSSGTLKIGKIWWEPGVKVTRNRLREFETAVAKLAKWIGAESIAMCV